MTTQSYYPYRLGCLIIAFGYWVYQFFATDLSLFGIHFRFLTHWALTGAMLTFAMLTMRAANGLADQYLGIIAAVSAINLLVVFLYWRLYLTDPTLLFGNDAPGLIWHQEYYLHLLGPFLLVFDALFYSRAFRQFWHGVLIATAVCLIYSLWIEVFVSPLNDTPLGSVTSGLPYRFLNNMEFGDRMAFYGTTVVTALGFYGLLWLISWVDRRFVRPR